MRPRPALSADRAGDPAEAKARLCDLMRIDASSETAGTDLVEAVRRLRADADALLVAFHDATRRPLGVTPASGDRFYDHRLAEAAEDRRPRVGTPAEAAERPEGQRDAARRENAALRRRLRRAAAAAGAIARRRAPGATGDVAVPASVVDRLLDALAEDGAPGA